MKKFFAVILAFLSCFTLFACDKKEDKVYIQYTNANVIMEGLISGSLDCGLLPEPVATKLEKVKGKDYDWHRIDVQELYDNETKSYPQAVLMVKNEVLENYPQLVGEIKSKFDTSEWLKNNINTAVDAVSSKYENTSLKPSSAIFKDTITNCNIYWEDALSSKQAVKTYIEQIRKIGIGLGIEPANAVEDDFFYNLSSDTNIIENKSFSFVVPDGAPSLAIAKFIYDEEDFILGANFNYSVVPSDDITKYMTGAISISDFIILPVNAASKLYKNKGYKMVAVLTHGNLYLMSRASYSVKDLKNKKIGVIGEGLVPDLTFKIILGKNNLGYETIK